MTRLILILFAGLLPFLLQECNRGSAISGTESGSETTNGCVRGTIVDSTGTPAAHVEILLIENQYNPIKDTTANFVLADTTDSKGMYRFNSLSHGNFNIQATDIIHRTKVFLSGIRVANDTIVRSADTLSGTTSIKLLLTDAQKDPNGYVYIPGSTMVFATNTASGFIVLDSVPVGFLPGIFYDIKNAVYTPHVLADSVFALSNDTATIAYPGWKHSRKLVLNTSATGANVPGTVTHFPLLIRLTDSNFSFSQTQANGADIRFTKANGTPLQFEIERWDASRKLAEIWVRLDTLYGNNATQSISMLFGAPLAQTLTSTTAFDTSDGFMAVWHMQPSGLTVCPDATSNGYNGTSPADSVPAPADGAIGACLQFNGTSQYVRMLKTAKSKLDFPEHGVYSISAWVYVDTLDTMYHKIVEKNFLQYKLQIDKFKNWSFSEYESSKQYETTNSPATAGTWIYLVGVRNGALQDLYANGVLVSSSIQLLTYTLDRNAATDITIGKSAELIPSAAEYYKGKIDEVRITNNTPSADWIKLCYMNQKATDALVVFK